MEEEEELANPWEEEEEPRDSDELFLKHFKLFFDFLFGPELVRALNQPCFTSRSDQDSLKSKQFSNKFIIIQTSQPMNRNRTRPAGV